MGRAADVKSVSAVRAFKTDLLEFQTALRQTLEALTNEVQRGVQWLESDRSAYWPMQVRKAGDRVSEARISLQRCTLATRSDERRSCYDEKKAFERARQRLAYAEQKVRSTKHWLRVVHHQAEQFQSRLARLEYLAEHDLPRAVAMLERLARALDKYVGYETAAVERGDRRDGQDAGGASAVGPEWKENGSPPCNGTNRDDP